VTLKYRDVIEHRGQRWIIKTVNPERDPAKPGQIQVRVYHNRREPDWPWTPDLLGCLRGTKPIKRDD